jgi:anti-anti-sigma factor
MTPLETSQPSGEPRLSTYTRGGYNVAALSGELDIASAPVLREQLLDVLGPKASKLIVDLSQVSFCDASGLTVLIGTNRRARLLGGFLRLAAPAPPVAWALRITGLDLQLDIFPTLAAAIAGAPASPRIADGRKRGHTDMAIAGHAGEEVLTPAVVPDTNDLREAVTAVLAHADAWRDADPNRKFTLTLRTLDRAHAGLDRTALIVAARSLLAALSRHPLTHSPAVAATATDLRRLLEPRPHTASGPGWSGSRVAGRPA